MAKRFAVSPLTNTIYYGDVNEEKQMFTVKKEDVTEEVIRAVFEWFVLSKPEVSTEYKITYPSSEYELVLRKKED